MMKKIFALVLLLVLGKMSYSQYPIQQNLGSDSTIVISKGALQSRLIPIVVSDTTAANAQRMKTYPGAQLYTTNGNFYIRNANATKWVLISSGSSGPTNIYNSDGTLTGNRTLSGANNNLTFDNLNKFRVNTNDSVLYNTPNFNIKNLSGDLSVEGTVTGATSSLRLKTFEDGDWTIKTGRVGLELGDLRFYDNVNSPSSTRMIIKANGNVGVGTDSPDSLLTVAQGAYFQRGVRMSGLPTALGTKALRIDANGRLSVADTTLGGGTVTSVATNDGTGIKGGTITTSGTLYIDTTVISTRAWRQKGIDSVANLPRVTSVGLTMPAAFNVAGSPVTSSGTLAVTAAGLSTQYIRGDGQLANFPGGGGGGGSSVVYYFNGGTNQGTFVGNTYYEMSKTAIVGTAANFTINADGYITQFITDAGDPALLNIPAGNWNFEMYFSASSGGGSPSFYVELYKYDGTTFTLISSSSSSPEGITGGTATDLYLTALAVPATSLTLTDRLAVRVYVTHSGRTITLHTQDNTICQVTTTFTTGITALNGLTEQVQYFATGTSGTDFAISSASATHTFNLPTASATNRGALSSSDWTTFNSKISPSDTASMLAPYLRKADTTAMLANYVNNVGYGLSKAGQVVSADSSTLANYFLRRKDSLTSTNLLGYVTRTILADTAAAIRSADAGGTVTSIATNNGTGITGGTITTTGTLAIDTLLISTRAWRQKGVDSVAALVNSNVSGTTNRVSKFTGANTIGNSSIADSSSSVAMTILSNGNIGINTTAPNERLEIVGTSRFTRTTSPSVYLNISMENGFAEYDARGSIDHVWENGGVENMRLALGGNLGIGTASPDSMLTVLQGARFQRGVRMSGLPSAPGTKALRIDANGTLSVADTTTGGGGGTIGGSGTVNYLPKFTASTTLGDSRFFDDGTTTFLGNGDVNATPSTGIFSGTGGTGTNIAGAELRIRGGASTGSAAGGPITFYTAAAGTAGTGVNAATEIARFTTAGRLGIGTSSPINRFHSVGDGVAIQRSSADAFGNAFDFLKSRGTATSPANVNDGDGLLQMRFAAYSGGDYRFTNIILGTVDGTFTSGQTPPSRLGFFTNTAGGSATERLRITSGGSIGIGTTTIGSTLQVNGNAAIGYSASTAAPTNGLAVAGNTIIGGATTSAFLQVKGSGTTSSTYQIYTNNSTSSTFFYVRDDGVVGATNVSANSGTYGSGTGTQTPFTAIGGSANLQIRFTSGSTDASIFNGSGGGLKLETNSGANAIYINGSGNTGLGTTTVGSKLQVNGGAAIGYSASTSAPTNGLAVAGNVGIGTSLSSIPLLVTSSATTQAQFNTTGANGRSLISANSLTSSIDIRAHGASYVETLFGTSVTNATVMYAQPAAVGFLLGTGTNFDLIFGTNNTIVGRFTAGGQLTLATGSNVSAIAQTGYSLTGSNAQSLIDLAGTWNTTGNPTAIKLNITNTASGATSKLMDLQVGSVSQFQVSKAGAIQTTSPTGGTAKAWKFGSAGITLGGSNLSGVEVEIDGTLYYLVTGYLPEPDPDPAAAPASGPSGNYKAYNKPTPVKSAQDAKIQALERELAELKEMVKKIANK